MSQPFGISDCADPEWLNSRIEREQAIADYYCDPDDTDCMDFDDWEEEQ